MAPQQAFSWSASWSSWLTIGDGKKNEDYEHNNLVKVEAFPRSKEMLRSERQENFPVLIQVTAPPVLEGTARAGVDVVAVLDVSGSMEGERLEHVKEAMEIFIGKLGPDDRLSVVSFATSVRRLTELTYMSEQGRAVAKEIVDGLVADGSTNMGAALLEGAMILRDRKGARDESNGRVGCMMFLSDGTNDEIYKEDISGEFPAHTFGLGSDHNPNVMRHIADETSATYSFVNRNIADIKGAFDLFISGLTSVVATAVRVTVRAHAGAAVSSIRSGGYAHRVAADRLSGAIDIHDMYAGERKCFVVYLTVAEGGGGRKKRLLTVGGSYRRSSDVMSSQLMLRDVEVSVVRPRWWCSAAELAIHGEVAAELARIKLEDGVAAIADHPTGAGLQEVWSGVMASAAGVPEATMSQLRDDVGEMMKGIEDPDEHKKLGLPYMLSWLTCHRWQRATTKNSPSNTDSFQRLPVGATPTTPWTPWWKTMTTTRWSRYALMCGGFLLAAAFLYFAVAGVVLVLGPSLPAMNHRNGNGNATMDITRQAGWAKMEHDLEAVITTAKSDGETGSLFRRAAAAASSEWSIDGEIDRYLYMAIVHATVLRSQRRGSTGVISEKVVRREVERYLRRMPKAMEVVEIPSFEGTTVEQTKNGMNRYLYSTIVQTNVEEDETTPTPPRKPDDTNPTKPKPEPKPEPEPEPRYMVIRVWSWMTSTISTTWSWTTSTASIAWSSSRDLLLHIIKPTPPPPTPTRISELEEQNLLLEQNLRKEQATSSTLSEKLHELEQRLKERMDAAATAERQLQEQAALLRQQVEEKEKAVARLRSEAAASAARLEACVEKEARSGGCCERVRKLEAVVRELRG